MAQILLVSNGNYGNQYEYHGVTTTRETFKIVNSVDEILLEINERYHNKENDVIIAKIINIENNDRITLQYCANGVCGGLYVRKTNPHKSEIENGNSKNTFVKKHSVNNVIMPLKKAFLEEIFNRFDFK